VKLKVPGRRQGTYSIGTTRWLMLARWRLEPAIRNTSSISAGLGNRTVGNRRRNRPSLADRGRDDFSAPWDPDCPVRFGTAIVDVDGAHLGFLRQFCDRRRRHGDEVHGLSPRSSPDAHVQHHLHHFAIGQPRHQGAGRTNCLGLATSRRSSETNSPGGGTSAACEAQSVFAVARFAVLIR
jgi:hypothetical protein